MSLILTIDTSTENASMALSDNGRLLCLYTSSQQKDHATWLHTSVKEAMSKTDKKMTDLVAIAVTDGPGSYTGLRVGMAAAKGFCYALKLPLITINSLFAIAHAVMEETADFICPLIDARRMEVFTAIYTKSLNQLEAPSAMIVDQQSFQSYLSSGKVAFVGSGAAKLKSLINSGNAIWPGQIFNVSYIVGLVHKRFDEKQFADLAYSEPFYAKEFYTK